MSNPSGLCKCGCGQPTRIAPHSNRYHGWVKGQPLDYVHGHNQSGPRNSRYKMGLGLRIKDGRKRWVITCRDGSKAYFARAVVEAEIKRHLSSREHVHHVNGDTLDDSPENLQITTNAGHRKLHAYDADDLIRQFRGLAKRLGRIPRQKDCDQDQSTPTAQTYVRHFGRWYQVIRSCGLENKETAYVHRLKVTPPRKEGSRDQDDRSKKLSVAC